MIRIRNEKEHLSVEKSVRNQSNPQAVRELQQTKSKPI